MAVYISKRKQLYRNILFVSLVLIVALAGYIAFFLKPTVTVSFYTNVDDMAKAPITLEKGQVFGEENYNSLLDFTVSLSTRKSGYILEGWKVDEDTMLTADTVFQENTMLIANWIPKQYQVHFSLSSVNGIDGEYSGDISQLETTIDFGSTYTTPSKQGFYLGDLQVDGLILDYWEIAHNEQHVAAGGNVVINNFLMVDESIDPTSSDDMVYGIITFIAHWKEQEITITFNTNYPEDTNVSDELVIDKGIAIPNGTTLPTYTTTGYDFNGWYLDQAQTQAVDLNTYVFTDDTQIYAGWSIKDMSVTFNGNGGLPASYVQTVQYKDVLSSPEPPLRDGWRLVGWYTNSLMDVETDTPYDFDSQVLSDFTLYAGWIEEDYTNEGSPALWFNTVADSAGTGLRISGITAAGKAGQTGIISIPELINGQNVTEIGARAFRDITNLVQVNISPLITYIHSEAFYTGLNELTTIKVWTSNPNYKDIDGVLYTKDGSVLMRYPSGRTDTSYIVGTEGRNVDTINSFAFSGDQNLQTLTINVETINYSAFGDMASLTTLNLSDKVSSISERILLNTTTIQTITIDANNTHYIYDGRAIYTHDYGRLVYYKPSANSIYYVNSNTTVIGTYAFDAATNLQTLHLENTTMLTTIEAYAFNGATSLSVVLFPTTNNITLQGYVFLGCLSFVNFYPPANITTFPAIPTIIFSGTVNVTVHVYAGSAAQTYFTNLAAPNITIDVLP